MTRRLDESRSQLSMFIHCPSAICFAATTAVYARFSVPFCLGCRYHRPSSPFWLPQKVRVLMGASGYHQGGNRAVSQTIQHIRRWAILAGTSQYCSTLACDLLVTSKETSSLRTKPRVGAWSGNASYSPLSHCGSLWHTL